MELKLVVQLDLALLDIVLKVGDSTLLISLELRESLIKCLLLE